MRALILSTIAIASLSPISHAATFGVTPQVGLAGAGATVQWGFNEYLALSAGYTGLDRSISDVKTDDATYDADISIKNPQLFVRRRTLQVQSTTHSTGRYFVSPIIQRRYWH